MAQNNNLDPAVKDTVNRLRDNAEKLHNGDNGDIKAIGRLVADEAHLLAAIVETQHMTIHDCHEEQEKMKGTFHEIAKEESRGWGINLYTSIVIITGIFTAAGLILKLTL